MYAEHGKHPREALFYAVSTVVLIVYVIRRHMHSATIMYLFTVKMFLCRKRSSELKKRSFIHWLNKKSRSRIQSAPRYSTMYFTLSDR